MVEVAIDRLGHLGDGIGRGSDAPVLVARTLPGEVVRGEVAGGRIAQPRIVTPSPDRVTPPCPHYRACGGCAVMHASDRFVAEWKIGVVRQALAAQGLEAEIAGIATSPPASRRRATLSGRRLKSGPVVGFHGRASDQVTAVPGCRVLVPEIVQALPALEAIVARIGARKGEVRLIVTASETGLDVAASGGRPLAAEDLAALAVESGAQVARLTLDGDVVAQDRVPRLAFGGIAVEPPPGAFLQATVEGEAALRAVVAEATRDAAVVADLFAGCGTFALPLARRARVHAVEGDAALLGALDGGWRRAEGLRQVTCEARDLYRRPLSPDELARFDAVVVDPPRAGAEAQMRALAGSRVARVASLSCNPVTFARDARILVEAGFAAGPVTVIDQFRWSAHVELAAAFTR